MRINEASSRSRLPAKTIRYYEEAGLLEPATRRQNGYREYTEKDVHLLRFVQRVKNLFANVDAGHVYVAMPPLYRIDIGKEVFYALDESEKEGVLDRIVAEKKRGKPMVQRFKVSAASSSQGPSGESSIVPHESDQRAPQAAPAYRNVKSGFRSGASIFQ